MDRYAAELHQRLAEIPPAQGTYVRPRGQSLLVGRTEKTSSGRDAPDDRLKLDRVAGTARFHLKVRLANGRWESTHAGGTLRELADFIASALPHYLADWPSPPRTSETHH
jgi:hypothetical protein